MATPEKDAAKLEQATDAAERRALEMTALLEVLASSRRLLWINFLAGLARGVGFFLGASLVGGLLIGVLAVLFDKAATTIGFHDLSLKDVVRAVVVKFEEIRLEVESVQQELKDKQRPPDTPPAETEISLPPVPPQDG